MIAHPTSAAAAQVLGPGLQAMSDLLPIAHEGSARGLHAANAAMPSGGADCDPLLQPPLAFPGLPWPLAGLPSPATAGRQPMGPWRVRAARWRPRRWRRRGPLCGVAGDHGGGTKRGQGGSRVPFLRPMFSTPHNLSEFNLPLRALPVENSFMSTNPGRSKGRHRDRFEGGDVAILLPLFFFFF